jgi:hypothetical protein
MPAHRLIANLKSQWVRLVLGWCAPEIIGDIYRGLLNRMPTSAEAAASGAELKLHRDLARVLKPIPDSGEFQQRMFVSRAPESVKAAYRAVLGREPDPEGESAHTSFLVKTGDFPALLSAMRDSAEFKRRELARLAPDFVDAGYEGLLGRPADPAERATDITSLTAEDDLAPFLRRLVHSPELQRKVVASHLPERARADFLTPNPIPATTIFSIPPPPPGSSVKRSPSFSGALRRKRTSRHNRQESRYLNFAKLCCGRTSFSANWRNRRLSRPRPRKKSTR